VLLDLRPGADLQGVADVILGWGDVSVYTAEEQRDLLLRGSVDRARRQIGLFRALLVIISGIIMALILYTLTLDKVHDIAMLKIMGARVSVILGLIVQQSLLLGALGFGIAHLLGQWAFARFPRRVIITEGDLWRLAAVVLAISLAASVLGIWKALKVRPGEIL
jgi:putative ABC transport system permease protein